MVQLRDALYKPPAARILAPPLDHQWSRLFLLALYSVVPFALLGVQTLCVMFHGIYAPSSQDRGDLNLGWWMSGVGMFLGSVASFLHVQNTAETRYLIDLTFSTVFLLLLTAWFLAGLTLVQWWSATQLGFVVLAFAGFATGLAFRVAHFPSYRDDVLQRLRVLGGRRVVLLEKRAPALVELFTGEAKRDEGNMEDGAAEGEAGSKKKATAGKNLGEESSRLGKSFQLQATANLLVYPQTRADWKHIREAEILPKIDFPEEYYKEQDFLAPWPALATPTTLRSCCCNIPVKVQRELKRWWTPGLVILGVLSVLVGVLLILEDVTPDDKVLPKNQTRVRNVTFWYDLSISTYLDAESSAWSHIFGKALFLFGFLLETIGVIYRHVPQYKGREQPWNVFSASLSTVALVLSFVYVVIPDNSSTKLYEDDPGVSFYVADAFKKVAFAAVFLYQLLHSLVLLVDTLQEFLTDLPTRRTLYLLSSGACFVSFLQLLYLIGHWAKSNLPDQDAVRSANFAEWVVLLLQQCWFLFVLAILPTVVDRVNWEQVKRAPGFVPKEEDDYHLAYRMESMRRYAEELDEYEQYRLELAEYEKEKAEYEALYGFDSSVYDAEKGRESFDATSRHSNSTTASSTGQLVYGRSCSATGPRDTQNSVPEVGYVEQLDGTGGTRSSTRELRSSARKRIGAGTDADEKAEQKAIRGSEESGKDTLQEQTPASRFSGAVNSFDGRRPKPVSPPSAV
ncbi:unnamed protein product [Amoebophrya sp. A120]|nr:unnamed protein product [Amoebophrya sp. A120]|eukprot:GSA120T00004775001.1